jgi:hypothetical protein
VDGPARRRYEELLDREEALLAAIRDLRALGLQPTRELPGGADLLRELRENARLQTHALQALEAEVLKPLGAFGKIGQRIADEMARRGLWCPG